METTTAGMLLPAQIAPAAKKIALLNSKGGSGKSTVATTLAGYYAFQGYATALYDFDPLGSSMRWVAGRPSDKAPVHGVAAYGANKPGATRSWRLRVPPDTQRIIIDTPAGINTQQMAEVVRSVDTIVIPVLPSPSDIHVATHVVRDLLLTGKIRTSGVRFTVIANRVREDTSVYQGFRRFLDALRIPLLTHLRDCRHYVQAGERGLSILELQSRRTRADLKLWQPLLDWLEETPEPSRYAPMPARADAPIARLPR